MTGMAQESILQQNSDHMIVYVLNVVAIFSMSSLHMECYHTP